jgi:hypothetical protein
MHAGAFGKSVSIGFRLADLRRRFRVRLRLGLDKVSIARASPGENGVQMTFHCHEQLPQDGRNAMGGQKVSGLLAFSSHDRR